MTQDLAACCTETSPLCATVIFPPTTGLAFIIALDAGERMSAIRERQLGPAARGMRYVAEEQGFRCEDKRASVKLCRKIRIQEPVTSLGADVEYSPGEGNGNHAVIRTIPVQPIRIELPTPESRRPIVVRKKRPRISLDDDDEDEHDSGRRSHSLTPPPHATTSVPPPPLSVSTTPSPEPRLPAPEPDLDEGDGGETEGDASLPENLSMPKKGSSSGGSAPSPPGTLQQPPYLLYHQQYQHYQQQQQVYPHHVYPPHPPQRSPVDILLRVFPTRRRGDVESTLHRCKGDILQAIELLVCAPQSEDTPPPLLAKSAFSPLGHPVQFHRYSPQSHRRFLAAPYTGTGYLPTVIRPPGPEYGMPLVGHPHDLYPGTTTGGVCPEKAPASSPGSGSGSDKTSYSE
uniref:DMA domain-containing protein n=1 Tax=Timema shepardi TaxID=629360 RepID=A0A7R9ATP9_TIMSH|nr:unnamed protein product [Timema shepardi]